ncbi:MAG: RHS repeat domain-containing protein, partial [bacterium]
RWYNPVIGRFVVKDPLKEGVNRQIYAMDTPVNLTDPKGLQPNCPSCFLRNCLNTPVDENTFKTIWKCLWDCQAKASSGFGGWAKCIAKCVGKGFLPDLVATLVCCYDFWYNYSDVTAGYNNPCLHPKVCEDETRWVTCCDFTYLCKCKILAAFEVGGKPWKYPLELWKCDKEYKSCAASNPCCYPLK